MHILALSALCLAFAPVTEKVYVCDSKASVAYHSDRDCRGLNKCKHEIIFVAKQDAINTYSKRACKICY